MRHISGNMLNTTAPVPKPSTFGDPTKLPPALLPLTQQRRWVIWKWEQRGNGKWTKPPYQPCFYNELAATDNPTTWGTYAAAVLALTAGHCDGIGFMLKGSEIAAIDLDHIRDFATGQVLRWVEELFVEAANAGCYLEWTVSGTGARIIGITGGGELHKKINVNRKTGCAVEFYRDCARYITISGFQVSGDYPGLPVPTTLAQCDRLFDAILARFCDNTRRPTLEQCQFIPGLHVSIEEIPEDENEAGAPASSFNFDLNNAGPQGGEAAYQDLIENGAPQGERSEEFQRVVWHLAAQGKSAQEIAEELAQHPTGIGAKYAGRLLPEVQRSYRKWQAHRQATAMGAAPALSTGPAASAQVAAAPVGALWPQIRVVASELPRVINEAEQALLLYGAEVYQRGGLMVRPVLTKFEASDKREAMGWHLIPVTRPWLVNTLTCAARFWRYNGRSKAWVPIDAPDKVADTYLARRGAWKLAVLTGIIHHPFLRADGSICEQPGYDAASGLLFKPEGERYPPVPLQPSKSDAVAALGKLAELIKEFPFVQDKDRSVALSAILTTLDRRSMPTAPLHALTSPAPGTGKSLLVDTCAVLATGRPMPVISQGHSEEELEKRLGAALLAGDTGISLDNCDREVGGAFLCQALTQRHVNIRILGLSRNAETPSNATIFATGNNLVIAGDATRRALLCAMDAGLERPETRVFSSNVIEVAQQRRGELVVAALTVLRAWHIAGERIGLSPFGSFDRWSYRIREPLVWLGQIDPCETLIDVRKSDPQRDALIAVLMQWELHLGINHRYTVQDVIGRAINEPTLYTALISVAGSSSGQSVSNERLGRWLKRVQGKIANGLVLVQDGNTHGYPQWKLNKR
jgi:hypothetical protein